MNLMNKLVILALLVTAISAIRPKKSINSVNLAYYNKNEVPFTTLTQAPTCPGPNAAIKCEGLSNRYRTLDGTCNNIKYPWWGAAQTPYNRLIKPIPTCDSNAPRTDTLLDVSGLPTAYDVVKEITNLDGVDSNAETNEFFAMFGVFVRYDTTFTVPAYVECECGSAEPECFNIQLSNADQEPLGVAGTESLNRECLTNVRSLDSKEAFDCAFDHREQLSKVSHYLDLSNIYGVNDKQNALVRTYSDGKLRTDTVTITGITDLTVIPPILDKNECIDNTNVNGDDFTSDGCFYGADSRAFIEIQLTAMYTLFIREHNRIAIKLKEQNGHWSDTTLYQETRRIVIAIYQNMIYGEYLPILIGEAKVKEFKLKPLTTGHGYFYNDYLYPNIYNEFATAGFQLQNFIAELITLDTDRNLDNLLWRQYISYQFLENALQVLVEQRSLSGEFKIADSLVRLFAETPLIKIDQGGSLPALIVQQGRDHALEAYITYKTLASGGNPKTFEELTNVAAAVQTSLKQVYNKVSDIDLWMGLLAEDKLDDAQVGKTQAFIIGKQFNILKYGDRFYYENGEDKVNRFTEEQLNSIRGYKANKLQCNNINNPLSATVQFNTKGFFINDGTTNPAIDCTNLVDINFVLWKDVPKQNLYY